MINHTSYNISDLAILLRDVEEADIWYSTSFHHHASSFSPKAQPEDHRAYHLSHVTLIFATCLCSPFSTTATSFVVSFSSMLWKTLSFLIRISCWVMICPSSSLHDVVFSSAISPRCILRWHLLIPNYLSYLIHNSVLPLFSGPKLDSNILSKGWGTRT